MQGYFLLELADTVVPTQFFWNFNLSQEKNYLQKALTTLDMCFSLSGFKVDSLPLPKQQRATGWVTLVSSRNPLRRSEAQRSVRSKRTFQMPRMKGKGHEDVCFDANINMIWIYIYIQYIILSQRIRTIQWMNFKQSNGKRQTQQFVTKKHNVNDFFHHFNAEYMKARPVPA